MFEYIKTAFKVGDCIKITTSNGAFEGEIKHIDGDSIILKNTSKTVGIKGADITFFEAVEKDIKETLSKNEGIVPMNTDVDNSSKEVIKLDSKNIEEENIEKSAKNQQTYKVGDVNSTDELKKIDPAAKNPKFQKKNEKLKTLQGGLESLKVLVEDEHKIENSKIIPAKGEIEIVFPDRNFGFIKDAFEKKIYFSLNEIIDGDLASTQYLKYAPVVFSLNKNYKGETATCIHKPKKVSELLLLAQSLSKKDDYKKALEVLDHILDEYPDNFSADNLKKEIKKNGRSFFPNKKSYSNLYQKAKIYDQEKKFDLALEYYYKALEKHEKEESCIKDIASIYAALYRSAEDDRKNEYRNNAIEFLSRYEKGLPRMLSTWQHLENVYYSIKDFDDFFRIVDILTNDKIFIRDNRKHSTLLAKKAAALIQLKDYEEADKILDESLSIYPNNSSAQKLKSVIEQAQSGEADIQIDDAISETEFDSLTSGLSPYIQQTLEDYDEYDGVPAKVIESGQFNEVTLKNIRNLIGTAGRARAKERARYILTECKLMISIEPDEETKLRSEMARYCNAMALNHISENSPLDIIRFFYLEAFSLEESYEAVGTQVSLYLLTYCSSYSELLNLNTKSPSVNNALSSILNKDFDIKKWESVLSMFLFNREITAVITTRLFDNYSKQAAQALKQWNIVVPENLSKDDFVTVWNEAREKRIGDYKRVSASIKSMANYSNIDQAVLSLSDSLKGIRDGEKWLCSLDIIRINNVITNVCPAIDTYIKSSGYRNKETTYNNIKGQVRQLVDEIKSGPTKISYEAILPLMDKLDSMIDASFENVIKTSVPKLEILLLSDDIIVDNENVVYLQISVSNDRDSSPISETSLKIVDSSDVKYIETDNTLPNAIEGGDNHIFKLQIKVSDKVKEDRAVALNLVCKYKNGEEVKTCEEQLSLRLYSADDFEPIDNPYAPIADGGPVPIDSNMFFGREEFLKNRVDAILRSPSKQIIIYGQKRCGKSSVLLHLKKQLQDTGKVFCVSFSIGDIIQNISEATLYYKILKQIKDELEFLELDGKIVPDFTIPSLDDFMAEDKYNPSNTFTKQMSIFKLSCKKTDGWKDKKLVVMIDEFTYLYTEIKKGKISDSIMKQWKAITQNEKSQFSVVLVGQDVVPSFKKEDYAKNAFGVIEDIRLTYLQEEPAKDLINNPILDKNGNSRYVGNAVNCIMDYTSRNPYYIQIFCSRLVDYMNSKKLIKVTEADVKDVAESFVVGDQSLAEEKFDNLIRAGETEDLQEYPEEDILKILRYIAVGSKNIGSCNRYDINAFDDKEYENKIIKHLIDREVLEKRGENNYKIQVKLFQEWLLNH